jgi:hypothetical protein
MLENVEFNFIFFGFLVVYSIERKRVFFFLIFIIFFTESENGNKNQNGIITVVIIW